MSENKLQDFLKLLEENNVKYENIIIDKVKYDFYFKERKTCLIIVNENEYNEQTVHKNHFKMLRNRFIDLNISPIILYKSYFENKYDIVSNRLLYQLSNKAKKIDARKCKVEEIKYGEAKEFLNKYHFQGNISAKIRIGLIYKNELTVLVIFNKPRYNSKFEYEIGRYVVKFDYNVRGNFTKIFSYFIKKYNPKSIISYHDLLFGGNKVYRIAGFKRIEDSPPGFFWYKDNKTYNRRGFWKGMLPKKLSNFDPNLSAHTNMRNNGYVKIWDLGQAIYTWDSKNIV